MMNELDPLLHKYEEILHKIFENIAEIKSYNDPFTHQCDYRIFISSVNWLSWCKNVKISPDILSRSNVLQLFNSLSHHIDFFGKNGLEYIDFLHCLVVICNGEWGKSHYQITSKNERFMSLLKYLNEKLNFCSRNELEVELYIYYLYFIYSDTYEVLDEDRNSDLLALFQYFAAYGDKNNVSYLSSAKWKKCLEQLRVLDTIASSVLFFVIL